MSWKTPEEDGISADLGKMNRIRINRKGSRASRGKSSMKARGCQETGEQRAGSRVCVPAAVSILPC